MAAHRGPYAKTPEVRARIMQAATQIFAASGYRGTTMKEVAAACGLTAKGVAHHFRSKDELLMAVLADRDRESSRAAATTADSFEALFTSLAEARREPRLVELYAVLSAEAIAVEHPAHRYHEERYERVRSQLGSFFQAIVGDDISTSGLSALDLSTLFIAVIDGLQIQWLYDDSAVDLERLARAFVRTVLAPERVTAPSP